MNNYLKSFTIGSSFPVFALWFLKYQQIYDKTWSYEQATLVNPFFFGAMNVISYTLAKKYNWTLRKRLFIISLVSALIVVALNLNYNFYGYTTRTQFIEYAIRVFIYHSITYNVIIYHIEKQLDQKNLDNKVINVTKKKDNNYI